jgi:hypothetical protein
MISVIDTALIDVWWESVKSLCFDANDIYLVGSCMTECFFVRRWKRRRHWKRRIMMKGLGC